jgi:hypothetical protein
MKERWRWVVTRHNMFIFFVFWVLWSLLWFDCNLFTVSNFQMEHFYYQCWFCQATWKDFTSLAIGYEKISPQICVIFSLSQIDLLSGNCLVFSCCTLWLTLVKIHMTIYILKCLEMGIFVVYRTMPLLTRLCLIMGLT